MPEPVSPFALEQLNIVVRDLVVRILAARADSS
jgi:hypothetical protein